jgi:hypothetical protein
MNTFQKLLPIYNFRTSLLSVPSVAVTSEVCESTTLTEIVVKKLNYYSGIRKIEKYDVRAVSVDTAFVPIFCESQTTFLVNNQLDLQFFFRIHVYLF